MNNTQQIYFYSNAGIYFEFLAENPINNSAAKIIKEKDIATTECLSLDFFHFHISVQDA